MSIPSCGIWNDLGRIAEGVAGDAIRPFNTIPETMGLLRCSRATVYRLIAGGDDLELVKLGAKSLITGRSLERVIARLLGDRMKTASLERDAAAMADARGALHRTKQSKVLAET